MTKDLLVESAIATIVGDPDTTPHPPFTNIRCFGHFNMDYIWTKMSEQTH